MLDLWLLLVLLTLGAERRKASEALLRRKFAEGHAEPGWLRKGIVGHEVGGGAARAVLECDARTAGWAF